MATVKTNIDSLVAHVPEVKAAVRSERDKIAEIAKGLFAPHDNPGGHKITTSNGTTDAFVNLDGPAPLSVEFGHFARRCAHDTEIPDFVEGLHILGRAIGEAGR